MQMHAHAESKNFRKIVKQYFINFKRGKFWGTKYINPGGNKTNSTAFKE